MGKCTWDISSMHVNTTAKTCESEFQEISKIHRGKFSQFTFLKMRWQLSLVLVNEQGKSRQERKVHGHVVLLNFVSSLSSKKIFIIFLDYFITSLPSQKKKNLLATFGG